MGGVKSPRSFGDGFPRLNIVGSDTFRMPCGGFNFAPPQGAMKELEHYAHTVGQGAADVWHFTTDEIARIVKILVKCGIAGGRLVDYAKLLLEGKFELFLATMNAESGEKAHLDCLCALCHASEPNSKTNFGDKLIRAFALHHVKTTYGPLAERNLRHYLSGAGGQLEHPIVEMIDRDPGFQKQLVKDINDTAYGFNGKHRVLGEHAYDNLKGDAEILKNDMEHSDNMGSVGNIDHLYWEVLTTEHARSVNGVNPGRAMVHVRLWDKYEWNPQENRNTQCIHLAMEQAKQLGAKDFWEVGEGDVLLPLPTILIPPPLPPPAPKITPVPPLPPVKPVGPHKK